MIGGDFEKGLGEFEGNLQTEAQKPKPVAPAAQAAAAP